LYANRKAAMKAAGVTFGTQGYKDWDAKTRALMGVKKGDKFSSGQWMETFGSMEPDEINEAAGNVQFYLDDSLSSTSSSYAKQTKPGINQAISNFPALVRQRPGGAPQYQVVDNAEHFFGGYFKDAQGRRLSPTSDQAYTIDDEWVEQPTTEVKQGWDFVPGYFDKLQEAAPSWRVPSPQGGSMQPNSPLPGGLINPSIGAPVEEIDLTQGNEGLKFGGPATLNQTVNPYARRTTYAGLEGEMFGFNEALVALPGTYDAESAASFNAWQTNNLVPGSYHIVKPGDQYINPQTLKPTGNIDLPITGISGGNYKPGETLPQNFLPEGVGGQYWGIASPSGLRTDLIKLAASSGQNVLDHEYVHGGMRMVAANAPSWKGKIDFKGQDLFDVLFDKQKNEWDHVAMHIGIYAVNNDSMPSDFWDHPILKDINDDQSLTLEQKERMMVVRGKALGLRLNKAAGLVLAGPVSQENPGNWFNPSSETWFAGPDI
jgi:hypothetical protein